MLCGKLSLDDYHRPYIQSILNFEGQVLPPFMQDMDEYRYCLDQIGRCNHIEISNKPYVIEERKYFDLDEAVDAVNELVYSKRFASFEEVSHECLPRMPTPSPEPRKIRAPIIHTQRPAPETLTAV